MVAKESGTHWLGRTQERRADLSRQQSNEGPVHAWARPPAEGPGSQGAVRGEWKACARVDLLGIAASGCWREGRREGGKEGGREGRMPVWRCF